MKLTHSAQEPVCAATLLRHRAPGFGWISAGDAVGEQLLAGNGQTGLNGARKGTAGEFTRETAGGQRISEAFARRRMHRAPLVHPEGHWTCPGAVILSGYGRGFHGDCNSGCHADYRYCSGNAVFWHGRRKYRAGGLEPFPGASAASDAGNRGGRIRGASAPSAVARLRQIGRSTTAFARASKFRISADAGILEQERRIRAKTPWRSCGRRVAGRFHRFHFILATEEQHAFKNALTHGGGA